MRFKQYNIKCGKTSTLRHTPDRHKQRGGAVENMIFMHTYKTCERAWKWCENKRSYIERKTIR